MNPSTVFFLLSQLPNGVKAVEAVVQAIQTIMASDQAKTIEQSIGDLISHVTKGQPNSAALGPAAAPPAA